MSNLLAYLPERLRKSLEVEEFEQALQFWADKLQFDKEDLFEQFFIRTATWGLRLWEDFIGIEPDISMPYAFRRARIESKLRGLGITTKAIIENVAASFSNGSVEVIEHNEEYRFDMKFTGTIGIPPNMDDLTQAIDGIKPAHLAYAYIILFRVWDMVAHMTWEQAGAYTWDQLREGTL